MGKGGNPGTSTEAPNVEPKPVWSSGVPFYPPSDRYWRIGGEWYDLEPFLHKHPGGGEILKMARDRFEDCTYAFEAHHHNYARARAIIAIVHRYPNPSERVVCRCHVWRTCCSPGAAPTTPPEPEKRRQPEQRHRSDTNGAHVVAGTPQSGSGWRSRGASVSKHL